MFSVVTWIVCSWSPVTVEIVDCCALHLITSVHQLESALYDEIQIQQTRLPSNLRPTTRECVHLVMRGHFRSRDKDGSHTVQATVAENMLHANITALCLVELELLPIKGLHCGNRNFRPFWLLWPWPWPDDLRIWTRPVVREDIPHVRKQTSYMKAFKSYHLTDTQTDIRTDRQTDTTKTITHAALWVVKTFVVCCLQ